MRESKASLYFSRRVAAVAALALCPVFATAQYGGDPDSSVRSKLKPAAEFLADIGDRSRRVVYTPYPVSASLGIVRGFVHVTDGSAVLSRTDLAVESAFPIVLRRAYHSRRKSDADFGVGGWHLTLSERISKGPNGQLHYSYGNGNTIDLDRSGPIRSSLQAHMSDVLGVDDQGDTIEVRTRTGLSKRFARIGDAYLLESVVDAYANELAFRYSSRGLLLAVDGPDGAWLKITRDERGRVTRAQDSHGRAVRFRYDDWGRLEGVTDPGEHEWLYGYDEANRLVTTSTPNDVVDTEFTYGRNGRVTHARANGARWSFEYRGPFTRVTDGLGLTTEFAASASGVTARVINPLGTTTSLGFGRDGLPVSLIRNGAQVAEFQYEPGGAFPKYVRYSDPAGTWRSLAFDARGRVVRAEGAGSEQTYRVEAYGPALLPGRVVYSDGTAQEARFNGVGDLIHYTKRSGSSFSFERNGSLLAITDSERRQLKLEFDAPGRLVAATTPYGRTLSFGYNGIGLRESTDVSNGARVRYWYDASGSLFSSTTGFLQQEFPSYTYVLGADQRIEAVSSSSGQTDRYFYDARGLLVRVQEGATDTLKFEYDPFGRLRRAQYKDHAPNDYEYAPGEGDIVAQLSYRAVPVFNQQKEIDDFASRFDVGLTRTRPSGLGALTFDELAGEIALAVDPARWDPMSPLSRSFYALRIESLLRNEKSGIQAFTSPANRFFVPREYWSVNCCICYCDPELIIQCNPD